MGFTVAELERELLVDRLKNDNMRLEVEEARGSLGSLNSSCCNLTLKFHNR